MKQHPVIVGVIADTHVPDRVTGLHPEAIPLFRTAGVQHILHAGDIAVPSVLTELEEVAPVSAVRGNRDWAFHRKLPWAQRLVFAGTPLALVHGHGTLFDYLWDKWQFIAFGYNLKRYIPILERPYPDAKVIVFGHTHRPENFWNNGKLFFNPGSAGVVNPYTHIPSVGILRFEEGGIITGEIIPLTGAKQFGRRWVRSGDGISYKNTPIT